MATVDEVMEQEEIVLDEVQELEFAINELGGYVNSLKYMVKDIYPRHYDGGDRLSVSEIKNKLADIVDTVNDFQYDVGQIEVSVHNVENALEDLEGMEIEEVEA